MAPSKSEYEVERIVSDKYLVGKRFFFVKWKGFDTSHNTWEPEENLVNSPRLVNEYFGGKGLRDTKSRNISSTPSKSEYEVERIVSDKYLVGKRFFFVKWKGFDTSHNTWEPEENLVNCPQLVNEYFGGKGLRDTKSRNISSTLMRSMKMSKTRRTSIIALTSLKASPRGSRRSSVDSLAAKANDLQLVKNKNLQPAEANSKLAKVDESQLVEAKNSQRAKIDELQSAEANDSHPTEESVCDVSPSLETEPTAQTVATPLLPSQESVDQQVDSVGQKVGSVDQKLESVDQEVDVSTSTPEPSEKQLNEDSAEGKLLSRMGFTTMVPKIELVKIDENTSFLSPKEFNITKSGLKQKCPPRLSLNVTPANRRVSQRPRRSTLYARQSTADLSKALRPSRKKPVTCQTFSVVDLTNDSFTSADETGFSSSQLPSDNDRSWQRSPAVGRKFPNKLQVRLFDRTPRPEVLTSVPFLENFESDPESMTEWVTEDSDKENVRRSKRRGRPPKRGRDRLSTKKRKTSDRGVRSSRTRKSKILAAAEVPVKDLPKTDDAMVLLTEQNEAAGSNLVMFFPRLNLIKSIPVKMADKYYSQAVIDYYRRSTQPQVGVARRSF